MKLKVCSIVLLIFNISLYSQEINKKNILVDKYHEGINYYLSPITTNYKREVIFISMPSFDPEYSMALEIQEDIFKLKLRSFKINYWSLVFSQRKSNIKMVKSEIDTSVIKVTKGFAEKLEHLFQKVLSKEFTVTSKKYVLDGTNYTLRNNKYKREFHDSDIPQIKIYGDLVTLCESIASDLKNTNFNEEKCTGNIDSLLKAGIK